MPSAETKFFSLDVECAKGSNDQWLPIKIALVDQAENVLMDTFVNPSARVVDYLTAIHGIKLEDLDRAPSLESCLAKLRAILSRDSVLVGQSIDKDIDFLKLKKGVDFGDSIDIALFFALTPDAAISSTIPRRFTLEQTVRHLLSEKEFQAHNPVEDAKYAMRLFLQFKDSPSKREEAKMILRRQICPEKPPSPEGNRTANQRITSPGSPERTPIGPSVHRAQPARVAPSRPMANPRGVNHVHSSFNSRAIAQSPPHIGPSRPENGSATPRLPFKVITLSGNLGDLASRVTIVGKPATSHVFVVQSQFPVVISERTGMEPINFFHHKKITKEDIFTCGFVEGVFCGSADTIQKGLESMRTLQNSAGLVTQNLAMVTFNLIPCEAYVFTRNDDRALTCAVSNPSGIEDRYAQIISRSLAEYPELTPSRHNRRITDNEEWERWIADIEACDPGVQLPIPAIQLPMPAVQPPKPARGVRWQPKGVTPNGPAPTLYKQPPQMRFPASQPFFLPAFTPPLVFVPSVPQFSSHEVPFSFLHQPFFFPVTQSGALGWYPSN
eukprot:TRINITY_DN4320_c0_g1_i1.p1 TRINITY_DN4320_c0_g1~~TRINITY_DN4320_c0_g1_i1.p1  ORF type:complete len:554 (-),score=94.19 TRINITY_DN4320_c0_g1_i1:63-1724(-)